MIIIRDQARHTEDGHGKLGSYYSYIKHTHTVLKGYTYTHGNKTQHTADSSSCFLLPQNKHCASRPYIEGRLAFTEKGWSSDFPPPGSAFSPKRVMAFLLRGHNGVHCCGTVGDSHSIHLRGPFLTKTFPIKHS